VQEIGGYYRMALSYFFYVTDSGKPITLFILAPMSKQLDAIINLFKVF
jgi:hypothetical protein